jgi:TRAP-type C4-dicarboxylate transport system permease small subunit
MRGWSKMRNGFIRALEIWLTVMVALLTLDVLWGIFTRFVLGHQADFTDELARALLVWISMVGAALAFGAKAHLGVDYFVGKLHPEARKVNSIVVQLITLAFALTVFVIGGWGLAAGQLGQQLPTMPWLSRGAVYMSVPLSGLFIVLFTVENLIDIIRTPADRLGAMTKSEE